MGTFFSGAACFHIDCNSSLRKDKNTYAIENIDLNNTLFRNNKKGDQYLIPIIVGQLEGDILSTEVFTHDALNLPPTILNWSRTVPRP